MISGGSNVVFVCIASICNNTSWYGVECKVRSNPDTTTELLFQRYDGSVSVAWISEDIKSVQVFLFCSFRHTICLHEVWKKPNKRYEKTKDLQGDPTVTPVLSNRVMCIRNSLEDVPFPLSNTSELYGRVWAWSGRFGSLVDFNTTCINVGTIVARSKAFGNGKCHNQCGMEKSDNIAELHGG